MDFPVCPACHQSVIDDDPVECPFCGASMKGGKPTSKPVAKSLATAPARSAPAAKPASTGTGKPSAGKLSPGNTSPPVGKVPPGKSPPPGDDFPFDIELTSGKPAIQAYPQPSKQRSLKVICPMCDTAGYLPPTAAGQDVRCANDKCVMPVFTAPAPKKDEAPPPPPRKTSILPVLLAGVAVLGAAGGAAYWWLNLPPTNKGLSAEGKDAIR